MKKNKISFIGVILLLLVSIIISACSSDGDGSSNDSEQMQVQIAGGTSGGTYFLMANAMAQLLNTHQPDLFNASAQSTAGTPAILRLLEDSDAEFGIGQAGLAKDAIDGEGAFEKEFENFSSVSYIFPTVMHLAADKSANINDFSDFKGKRFSVGESGSATELNSRDLAEVYGLDYLNDDDFQAEYASEAQAVDLMNNRQVDGANLIAALGAGSVTDLMSSGNFEILSFSDEDLDKIIEHNPTYFKYTIEANTYPNQPEDIQTYAVANFIYANNDLSEDRVYTFLETIYDNLDELLDVHSSAEDMKLENALNGMTVPLHPGAEKFFKEKDVLEE